MIKRQPNFHVLSHIAQGKLYFLRVYMSSHKLKCFGILSGSKNLSSNLIRKTLIKTKLKYKNTRMSIQLGEVEYLNMNEYPKITKYMYI